MVLAAVGAVLEVPEALAVVAIKVARGDSGGGRGSGDGDGR